jgi:hypothetical protein
MIAYYSYVCKADLDLFLIHNERES